MCKTGGCCTPPDYAILVDPKIVFLIKTTQNSTVSFQWVDSAKMSKCEGTGSSVVSDQMADSYSQR